ncbi:VacJ family lipoprotein [Paraglaciecola sp.]|uniref:MlaA family lipoprotein n=1 Tax=Paraglaciecola sp. TaxID=1920173 RepID=UPI0030F42D6E
MWFKSDVNGLGYSFFSTDYVSKKSVNKMARVFSLLAVTLILGACAANTEQQSAAAETTSSPKAEKLLVKSSHGTFELEPTVVAYEPETFNDPLESFNRPVFAFNDFMFRHILTPVSHGYQAVVPSPVRSGVSNFFSNIREPLNAVNHVMQGSGSGLGTSVSRFLVNSTIGIFGLFDPADHWFDIKEKKATLNQTLASYDMGYGAFLVLPFLGQTDTRNGFSTVVEGIVHPINFISSSPDTFYIQAYGSFHEFSSQADSYETLKKHSEDPYLFFRNLYLQSVLRDQQFSEDSLASEPFPLNPHSTGHKAQSSLQKKSSDDLKTEQ